MSKKWLSGLNNQTVFFIATVIIFLIYSFIIVNRQGFWHDEIYTVSFVRGFDIYLFEGADLNISDAKTAFWYKAMLDKDSFWDNLYRNLIHEGHPPLYYLTLKLWSYLFGVNEIGLRSFSIFTSCLSLFVAFEIGKLFDKNKAFLFPLLIAVSPMFIYYAIEARSYSLYFLTALMCFFFFIKIIAPNSGKIKNNSIVCLIISAILLVFTHYYGVFLYFVMAIVLFGIFVRGKRYADILRLGIPAVALIPWIHIITQQTLAHEVHWTNGYLGFVPSLLQFLKGVLSISIAPISKDLDLAFWLLIVISVMLLIKFKKYELKSAPGLIIGSLLFLAYGFSIIMFDNLLDHHTIAVPRYYIPAQFILLFLFFYSVIYTQSLLLGSTLSIMLVSIFIYIQIDYYNGVREPKQMYRQAARYISQRYDPSEVQLIISPNGPTAVGISYYLTKDFSITATTASSLCTQYNLRKKVFIEQRLGLATEPWMLSCKTNLLEDRIVRFVGLDIITEK